MGLRPNVRVDVREALTLQEQAGPGIVAIIGTSTWGPIESMQTLASFSQGLNVFKDDKDSSGATISLPKGLDLLYRDGAGVVLAVRVADTDAAKSDEVFDGNSGGEAAVLTFSGLYEGTYGDNIGVTITADGATRTVEVTDGQLLEVYSNNGNGYTTNAAIAAAINGTSQLVSVAVKAGSESANLVDAITQTFLSGGDDGEDSLVAADYTDAFDNVLSNEDFDILVIPGGDALEALDSFHATMVGKLNTRASTEDKFAIFMSGIGIDETIATASARTASGARLSLVAPNLKYTHRADGTEQVFNGSYLACSYAARTASGLPHISPTHKTLNVEGVSVLQSTGKEYYNNGEQEQLLQNRIVPITKIGTSIQASRGVTRDADTSSIFYEVNIVRIVDYVKAQVFDKLNPFVGDPNLQRIRNIMAREVDGLLEQDKLDEIIVAYNATDVAEGSSPDTVLVTMSIRPTFAINFINVTLNISQVSE